MSHSTKIKSELRVSEKTHLISALKAVFGDANVEVHDQPTELMDWCNKPMRQYADIIVRHENLKGLVNDLGFRAKADGTYEVNLDNHTTDQLSAVTQNYNASLTAQQLEMEGYSVTRQLQPNGELVIIGESYT